MFRNVGKKIQGVAKFVCWLGIVLSVLMGLMMILSSGSMGMFTFNGVRVVSVGGTIAGVVTMVLGSLASWIGSWVTYGIGLAAEYAEKHMDD